MSYAATAWSDTTYQFDDRDGPMTREGTLLDGGVVADVGWLASPWLSPLLEVAADVERATWTSAYATRDPMLLRADLLGGVRLAPAWAATGSVAFHADLLAGGEVVTVPSGAPWWGSYTRIAPAAVLSLGAHLGTGRTRALVAIRARLDADVVMERVEVDCVWTADSCVSWSYAPGGSTVQVLLGVAFQ